MSNENSNHDEETIEDFDDLFDEQEDNNDTQTTDGDGSDDSEEVLARINEVTGKNYKSLDDFSKSQKELEKALAQKGREKKETLKEEKQKPQAPANRLMEEYFFDKHPEAKEYWDTVIEEAETLNKDPYDLYLSSKLLQKEAKSKYDKSQKKKDASTRMSKPSNQVDTTKSEEHNPFNKDYPAGFAINKK